MKILTVSKNDSGQRLDKYLLKVFTKLPKSLMYKEIRKKNIKINKKRTQPDYIIKEGEEISLYLKDDVLEEKRSITILLKPRRSLIFFMKMKT